jgi:DNA-binding transcriptional ArsR family regulator
MEAAAVFDALGDPTRRRVLELLRDGGEQAVGELAGHLPVSRPAVSQHLRVLEGAGLVGSRRDGTRHLYVVADDGLGALRAYLETFWDAALAAYAHAAEDAAGPGRSTDDGHRPDPQAPAGPHRAR